MKISNITRERLGLLGLLVGAPVVRAGPCNLPAPVIIENPTGVANSKFGYKLATNGTDLVAINSRTMVYVYRLIAGTWAADGTIDSPSYFSPLAVVGDRVVVGSSSTDSVIVYEQLGGGDWEVAQSIVVPDGARFFGASIAFDGVDTLFVGSTGFRGRIYPYRLVGSDFVSDGIIMEQPSWVANSNFGDGLDAADGSVVSKYGQWVDDFGGVGLGVVSISRSSGSGGWSISDQIRSGLSGGSCLDAEFFGNRAFISSGNIFVEGLAGATDPYFASIPRPANDDVYDFGDAARLPIANSNNFTVTRRGDDLVTADSSGVSVRVSAGPGCDSWSEIAFWSNASLGLSARVKGLAGVGDIIVASKYDTPEGGQVIILSDSCVTSCPADINGDGVANFFDVSAFLTAFNTQDPIADFNNDAEFNFFDVSAFLTAYSAGCP